MTYVPPIEQRPEPDTHRIEHSVRIAAPIEKVWSVLADHEGMAAWSGFDPVTIVKPGAPDRNGYGAERRMRGPAGTVVEQVVGWEPRRLLRYRVVKSSPFVCHQGEIRLTPAGSATELQWVIRFRPRLLGTGRLLRGLLARLVRTALTERLKPLVERTAKGMDHGH